MLPLQAEEGPSNQVSLTNQGACLTLAGSGLYDKHCLLYLGVEKPVTQ